MVRPYLSDQPSGKRGIKRLADFKPPEVVDPFEGCLEVKYDTGKSDGMQSYGGSGPAIRITLDDLSARMESGLKNLKLKGFRLYASRYGSGYDTEKTILRVNGFNPGGRVLWKDSFPYSLFDYKAKWVDLVLPRPVAAGDLITQEEPLMVAFDAQAHKYKGIYYHYNNNPQVSHSLVLNTERMFASPLN